MNYLYLILTLGFYDLIYPLKVNIEINVEKSRIHTRIDERYLSIALEPSLMRHNWCGLDFRWVKNSNYECVQN